LTLPVIQKLTPERFARVDKKLYRFSQA